MHDGARLHSPSTGSPCLQAGGKRSRALPAG
jgi:hypothetical protein